MHNYKRDNYQEIAQQLNELVELAELTDKEGSPKINIEDVQDLISQYSPDSTVLKDAIFKNIHFCLYCGIPIYNQSLEDMFKVSDFIKLNHKALAETQFKLTH